MKISHFTICFGVSIAALPFLIGCNRRTKTIQMSLPAAHLTKATLDTGKTLTLLQILDSYPAKQNCTDSLKYSNLYVCKKYSTGDTVYVF